MKKILILLFIFSSAIVFSQHNEEYVKEKLETVLSELDKTEPENYDFSFLEKIKDFLENTGVFFRILFIAVPASLIIFVIYKLHDFYMKNRNFQYNSDALLKTSERYKKVKDKYDDIFYRKASKFKENENYRLALIMLHKGSVDYLYRENKLDRNRDYTNREIIIQIQNTGLSDSFSHIAGKAEQIVFNSAECKKDEFEKYENIYRSSFL